MHRWKIAMGLALLPWGLPVLAQEQAYTRMPAALYVAPDEASNTVAVLNQNEPLWLYGCDQERAWCQVSWNSYSGWMAGEALIRIQGGTTTYIQQYDQWTVPVVIWGYGGPRPPAYPHPHPWPRPGEGPGPHPPGGAHPPFPGHPYPDPPAPRGPQPGEKGYTGAPPHR